MLASLVPTDAGARRDDLREVLPAGLVAGTEVSLRGVSERWICGRHDVPDNRYRTHCRKNPTVRTAALFSLHTAGLYIPAALARTGRKIGTTALPRRPAGIGSNRPSLASSSDQQERFEPVFRGVAVIDPSANRGRGRAIVRPRDFHQLARRRGTTSGCHGSLLALTGSTLRHPQAGEGVYGSRASEETDCRILRRRW